MKAFIQSIPGLRDLLVGIICFFGAFRIYLYNVLVANIPFHKIRLFLYRRSFNVGRGSSILMSVKIRGINILIGDNSIINGECLLDGRGESRLIIGNNVDIAPYVKLWTVDHDPHSNTHEFRNKDVYVGNNVWIASSVTVLPGVNIAEGTVVATGAVVTKDTEPYSIVAGIPAKKVGMRESNIEYSHSWRPWFE